MTDFSKHSDAELLRLLKSGDHYAYTELYNKNWKFLYNSAYNILRNHQDTMDVCQTLFMWIWEHHDKIEIKTNFRAYLFVAAKYRIANLIRDGRGRTDLFENADFEHLSDGDFNPLEVKELKNLIRQLIEELPPKCREIFIMSRECAMSHKEIAQELGISNKTVDEQISRALKKLKIPLNRLASIILLC